MRRASNKGRAKGWASILGALAAAATLLSLSCAAPLKIGASVDPLALLEGGSLAYARLSGNAARELAPSLFPASELASMKALLERTRIIALGLGSYPNGSASPTLQAPTFQAALIGDYPFRTASLAFGSSPDWKREKSAYYSARLGLARGDPRPEPPPRLERSPRAPHSGGEAPGPLADPREPIRPLLARARPLGPRSLRGNGRRLARRGHGRPRPRTPHRRLAPSRGKRIL